MKIYVDEIPKCCKECGFCRKDDLGYWCQAKSGEYKYICSEQVGERLDSCPLKTTQILKQLAREEVVEEIKGKIKNIEENIWAHYGEYGIISDMDYGQIFGLNKLLRVLGRVKGKNDVQD